MNPDPPETAPGRLWLGATSTLYLGPPLGVGFHRSSVVCLAYALDGAVEVTVQTPPLVSGLCCAALVGAGVTHRIDGTARRAAFLYLDPTDRLLGELTSTLRRIGNGLSVEADGSFLPPLLSREAARPPMDPRIARVLDALACDGDALTENVRDVAERVALSPSRFMHLFGEQVGVPFRRFRLGARMRAAARGIAAGSSLTNAALDAGFSTPSHFSEAFRAMFGAPPSILKGVEIFGSAITPSIVHTPTTRDLLALVLSESVAGARF